MSELALIERIAARTRRRAGTELGIGDDAAILSLGGTAVVTQDMLVDGVHFRLPETDLRDLGHTALAVNLSDLAAMGVEPVAAFVGLGLPAGGPSEGDLDAFYDGMEALAERFGVSVAGGDVTAAPALVVAVTAIGRPFPGVAPLTRSGGRPGDLLCVTGRLGAAAAGLLLRERPSLAGGVPEADARALHAARMRPEPRVGAGRALAAGGARALMDLSDGLALDALRMARASGVRARIELDAVPLAPGAAQVALAAGLRGWELAAAGGEDYELLAAVPAERLASLQEGLELPLTPVGRLEEGAPELVAVDGDGRVVELRHLGWEHDV